MIKHIRWLVNEVEQWYTEGIISQDQAEAIKSRYPMQPAHTWGRIIFFSLGAIIFGLGVILLFAYNWHALHKFVKLGVVFLAIFAAHGSGFWLCRPQSNNQAIGEGLHVLGTVLFGAGIWLIAQIYHISEHYPNGILLWSTGALAVAWAIPSTPQGIVAAFLLALWGGSEVFGFRQTNHLAPLIIIIGILPLAWFQKSQALLGAGIAAMLAAVAFNCGSLNKDLLIGVFILLSNILIASSIIVARNATFPESRKILSFFGNLVYIIVLYALTFKGVSRYIDFDFDTTASVLYMGTSTLLAIFCWVLVVIKAIRKSDTISQVFQSENVGYILTMVLVLGLGFIDRQGGWGWKGALIFNLLFLFHCVMLIIRGCKEVNLKQTTLGCLLFSLLAISRYIDLFSSLIARSMVFLIVGGTIFFTGFFYSQSKKQGLEENQ